MGRTQFHSGTVSDSFIIYHSWQEREMGHGIFRITSSH